MGINGQCLRDSLLGKHERFCWAWPVSGCRVAVIRVLHMPVGPRFWGRGDLHSAANLADSSSRSLSWNLIRNVIDWAAEFTNIHTCPTSLRTRQAWHRRPHVGSMLAQRCRRWADIEPALGQWIMLCLWAMHSYSIQVWHWRLVLQLASDRPPVQNGDLFYCKFRVGIL